MLFTAGIASAKYFFRHISRQNTLTQARRNISRHYDLVNSFTTHVPCSITSGISEILFDLWFQSNELFSLFLDESMTYSCAVFKVREVIFFVSIPWLSFPIYIYICFHLQWKIDLPCIDDACVHFFIERRWRLESCTNAKSFSFDWESESIQNY